MTRLVPSIDRIRNLGIIAHVDAGKTTLTERILLYTGRIHTAGDVHEGNTTTDCDPIEQTKGITIMAAAVTCDWRSHCIHLIDTPGHVDFTIEVERSLRVLDGAVCVLDAVAGVEPQTETVWRQADRHQVPRLCFVNKLDRPGADMERCLRGLRERLGARPIAITWPIWDDGGRLIGVVDVIEEKAWFWDDEDGMVCRAGPVPAQLFDNLRTLRELLVEACADEDSALLEVVVHGGEPSPAALRAALRQATIHGRAVPVLCGSAYHNRGVQPLLDAVVDYLPSPIDRAPVRDVEHDRARPPDRTAPLAALGFKVSFDAYGQMTFVRVYSGVLERGAQVTAVRSGRTFRVGRLVQLQANQRHDVDRLEAGEIGALLGAPLTTGETLAAPGHVIVLESIVAPEPMMRLAVEPKTKGDRERLALALSRMVAADPSLRLESDRDTGQSLLAGMGQLHLDIAVERLAREHGVDVITGRPLVAFRTTLGRTVQRELRHVKQSGGPGQYAHVVIEVGPASRGAGLIFEDRIRGGSIPRGYVAAVAAGVREAMSDGLCGGHPVVDVRVAVLDGSTHPNDSSELAFKIAGARAFRLAAEEAAPIVLEPIMLLEVTCPEDEVGAVIGDLGRRRAQVLGLDARGVDRIIRAEVPLAESFGYAGALSALTHGRGRFVLEPGRYEPIPVEARVRAIGA